MHTPFIVALDFPSKHDVQQFLRPFSGTPLFVKVGMELYYQEGPAIIAMFKEQGHAVFLDLKLHDIPNTVKQAMKGLARLGVDLVNVHAAGGRRMMEAAIEGLDAGTPSGAARPRCIAVTQLTSTDERMLHEELWISQPLEETVSHYAALAQASGMDGVVCSANEATLIKERCGASFLAVTPGIRFADDSVHDQVRVVTPRKARALGADYIVIGRSITRAADPLAAYSRLQHEWNGGETE
ncbi:MULTISPECIES: orotidine-5'-phosphate decarboxylase [Geobacillus]|uniref:Orotidine 5'-phosphate decarboxylase n=5 Tax=Geobacillus thermodenitrificans TaxID=33940 RepID=PYRF_GEOTN|nr:MULTISPECIES: orotidine-5'-phosphate decarboxylase [Geobacillus]A4IM36.1 RecName: Full=Orotidine 5'-phosphate decarboxylase; AltName: Full=OMP decarboxylase; Short=OMPDCase; Short=OMPdecase [Geobacillus thermodenitrificans NG80-2]ABO66390.1 Orotidine-5'-phosphate decarboxylase [Geobacillus thermodenitrificans NG80-2]ARA97218.1 orotidine 5'-phosphate decarboxylase [Geobacillus thermodenitrificans]ATO36505.1 orotidine 5'-phosphate decarboxylase [Geobacillus thermodenitrificans]KQB93784.1 Orot